MHADCCFEFCFLMRHCMRFSVSFKVVVDIRTVSISWGLTSMLTYTIRIRDLTNRDCRKLVNVFHFSWVLFLSSVFVEIYAHLFYKYFMMSDTSV